MCKNKKTATAKMKKYLLIPLFTAIGIWSTVITGIQIAKDISISEERCLNIIGQHKENDGNSYRVNTLSYVNHLEMGYIDGECLMIMRYANRKPEVDVIDFWNVRIIERQLRKYSVLKFKRK